MHVYGIYAGVFLFIMYNTFSAFMQWMYYSRQCGNSSKWKTQPTKGKERLGARASLPWVPLFDLFRSQDERVKKAPWHWALASINMCLACACAMYTVDGIATGRSKMYTSFNSEWPMSWCFLRWLGETTLILSLHQVRP